MGDHFVLPCTAGSTPRVMRCSEDPSVQHKELILAYHRQFSVGCGACGTCTNPRCASSPHYEFGRTVHNPKELFEFAVRHASLYFQRGEGESATVPRLYLCANHGFPMHCAHLNVLREDTLLSCNTAEGVMDVLDRGLRSDDALVKRLRQISVDATEDLVAFEKHLFERNIICPDHVERVLNTKGWTVERIFEDTFSEDGDGDHPESPQKQRSPRPLSPVPYVEVATVSDAHHWFQLDRERTGTHRLLEATLKSQQQRFFNTLVHAFPLPHLEAYGIEQSRVAAVVGEAEMEGTSGDELCAGAVHPALLGLDLECVRRSMHHVVQVLQGRTESFAALLRDAAIQISSFAICGKLEHESVMYGTGALRMSGEALGTRAVLSIMCMASYLAPREREQVFRPLAEAVMVCPAIHDVLCTRLAMLSTAEFERLVGCWQHQVSVTLYSSSAAASDSVTRASLTVLRILYIANYRYNVDGKLPLDAFHNTTLNERVDVTITQTTRFISPDDVFPVLLDPAGFRLWWELHARVRQERILNELSCITYGQARVLRVSLHTQTPDVLLKSAVDEIARRRDSDGTLFKKPLVVAYKGIGPAEPRDFMQKIWPLLFGEDGVLSLNPKSGLAWFTPDILHEGRAEECRRQLRLAGLLLGLCFANNLLPMPEVRFPLVLYKRLLYADDPVTIEDLREVDPDRARSLQLLLDGPGDEELVRASSARLLRKGSLRNPCFCVEYTDRIGNVVTVDLKEDGRKVPVQPSNAREYAALYVQHILRDSIADSFRVFRDAFEEVCEGLLSLGPNVLRPSHLRDLVASSESAARGVYFDTALLRGLQGAVCVRSAVDSRVHEWLRGGPADLDPTVSLFWEILFHDFDVDTQKIVLQSVGAEAVDKDTRCTFSVGTYLVCLKVDFDLVIYDTGVPIERSVSVVCPERNRARVTLPRTSDREELKKCLESWVKELKAKSIEAQSVNVVV
eukprot:PhM_4_TR717/c0_g4_i1/m.91623/K10587/UBE3A, E6AP; ubiquitin-protein ligase E3 A